MHTLVGGAAAKPFDTHHNALDMRPVHADRAGAVPEAPRRGRARARVRDRALLPQRGHQHAAQPRVHDARVLPGVRDVRRPDGLHRGAARAASTQRLAAAMPAAHAAWKQARPFTLDAAVRARAHGPRRRARRRAHGDPRVARRGRGRRRPGPGHAPEDGLRRQHQGVGEDVAARQGARLGQLPQGPGEVRQRRRAPVRAATSTSPSRSWPTTTARTTARARCRCSSRTIRSRSRPSRARNDARPELDRPVRALRSRPRALQRVQRAERPRRPGRALPRAGREEGPRRRGGDGLRRRLHPRARARDAAGGRLRHGNRSPRHGADERGVHPRRHPVPAAAARGGPERAAREDRCPSPSSLAIASPSLGSRPSRSSSGARGVDFRRKETTCAASCRRSARSSGVLFVGLHATGPRGCPCCAGSAWNAARHGSSARAPSSTGVLFLVGTVVALLPWALDRLERGSFASYIAARHVRAKKSGFLTLISGLSIFAVALASFSLSGAISVMGGFSADLKRKILGNNAHIVVDTTSQSPWADYESGARARSRRSRAWSRRDAGRAGRGHGVERLEPRGRHRPRHRPGDDRRRHRSAQEHRGAGQGRGQARLPGEPRAPASHAGRRGHRHRLGRRGVHEGARPAAARRRPRPRGARRPCAARRCARAWSSAASSPRRSTCTWATR